jgi:hypothetical protein
MLMNSLSVGEPPKTTMNVRYILTMHMFYVFCLVAGTTFVLGGSCFVRVCLFCFERHKLRKCILWFWILAKTWLKMGDFFSTDLTSRESWAA